MIIFETEKPATMKNSYKFDKSFGPVASFSGMVIFAAGIIACWFDLTGLVFVVLGAFIGFTNSSTEIDSVNKKLKYSNNIFGIIKLGKWIEVKPDYYVRVKQERKVNRTYSMSNQKLDLKKQNTTVYLYNKQGKMLIPIMKTDTEKKSEIEIESICKTLGISRLK